MPTIYKPMTPQPDEWSDEIKHDSRPMKKCDYFIDTKTGERKHIFAEEIIPPYKTGDEIEIICPHCEADVSYLLSCRDCGGSRKSKSKVTSCTPELREGVWMWRTEL